MDKETKQLIEDWLEHINSPEFQERNERWLKRFWEIMEDYTWGLVDEDAFNELDNIDEPIKWMI